MYLTIVRHILETVAKMPSLLSVKLVHYESKLVHFSLKV